MRTMLLVAASVAAISALAATSAQAAPVVMTGDIDASYGNTSYHGVNFNDWGINGDVVAPIGSMWAVQGNLGYNSLERSNFNENTTYGVASGFAALNQGRAGASVGYGQLSVPGSHVDVTTYGVFGDWYVNKFVTLSARGGGLSTSGGGSTGSNDYVGGQVVGYALPDLALTGTVDSFKVQDVTQTQYSVGGEWLVSHQVPVSVSVAYTGTNLKAGGTTVNLNTYTAGLHLYFGGGSLRDHQRSGAEGWGASAPVQYLF